MNPLRNLIALAIVSVVCHSAAAQQAQPDAPANNAEPSEVRVFALQYMAANEAAEVTLQLMNPQHSTLKLAPDQRTNSLIASGDPKALQVVEAVLQRLDIAPAKEEQKTLRAYRIDDNEKTALRILQSVLDQGARVEQDKDAILVYGSNGVHDKVTAVLGELTKNAPEDSVDTYYIHVVWIVGTQEANRDWKLQPIPAGLKSLVEQKLAPRLGLNEPAMVGQILVRASASEKTEAHVEANGAGQLSEQKSFQMFCDTSLVRSSKGVSLKLNLTADIVGPSPPTTRGNFGRGQGRGNNLSTTIDVELDHPVCLGVTPAVGVDSVFLIQVTKDL